MIDDTNDEFDVDFVAKSWHNQLLLIIIVYIVNCYFSMTRS